MSSTVRRLMPFALAAALLVALTPTSAAAEMTASQAERYLVDLINKQRTDIGLRALRVDTRVRTVARERSVDMATHDYFSHTNSDGRKAWDMMSDEGITWYWAGEIIAMNTWGTLAESAEAADRGWHDSPGHYAIISNHDYNYIGIGHAFDPDRNAHIWTGVFLKGPDRTGGWSKMGSTSTAVSSTGVKVTVRWSGGDVQLSVLTAGFRAFRLQRRTDGGTWLTIYSATTKAYWADTLKRGHRYEFRVRSLDRAGNWGAWTAPKAVVL